MKLGAATVLLALLLFGWNLWGYGLWAPDEPYFGEGAREMVRDGRWLVPHVLGRVSTDKPPLLFWLIALLSLPAGRVTELTARLPSVLASAGSLLLVAWLGRKSIGARGTALAPAVLATSYLFWDKARTAQADALLCFFVLGAVAAFAAWRAGEMEGRVAGLVFWGAAGLAALAKGPVGVLLPLGIALLVLAWDRRLAAWRFFAPAAGPALAAAIVLAWAVPASTGAGGEYSLGQALRRHALERALYGMHHVQPFWYYLEVLPVKLLPWSPLLPGAVLAAWKRRDDPWSRLLLVQAAFVVLFFSIWTEKRDLYVLPACPAFAVLVARLVGEAGATVHRRWVTAPVALLWAGMLLAAAAASVAAHRAESLPRHAAGLLALGIGAAAAVVAAGWTRGKPAVAAWSVVAAFAGLYVLTAQAIYPALDPVKSARRFAVELAERTEAHRRLGRPVIGHRLGNLPRAIAFYTDGLYLEGIDDPQALALALEGAEEGYVVTGAAEMEGWAPELRRRAEVVLARDLARTRVCLVRIAPLVRPAITRRPARASPGACPPPAAG